MNDIDFDSFQLKYGEYNSKIETRAKSCHRRISKYLTYDIQNRMNKSFVEIIRDRVYAEDSPLYPKLTSPTTKSSLTPTKSNKISDNKRSKNNDIIKMSRIKRYIDLDDNNNNNNNNNNSNSNSNSNNVNPNLNDEQLLHDVSLELKNLNMYCDYTTPTPKTFAPNRLKEKALQKGLSLASIVKQQLYRSNAHLSSSMRFSPSKSPSKNRPSTADDSRRRYEARQRLKNKKNNQTSNVNYNPFYYSFYNDLQYYDLLLSAEYCSNCNNHISLRHDSKQYEVITKNCIEILLQLLADYKLNARIGMIKVTPSVQTSIKENDNNSNNKTISKSNTPSLKRPVSAPSLRSKDEAKNDAIHNNNSINNCNSTIPGSRLGALEIQIAYKDSTGKMHLKVIHSKLQSLTWPIKAKLIENFKIFIQEYKNSGIITSYSNNFLGMYDFLLIDDSDTPKKDQIQTDTPTETIKDQIQTCPMFDKCNRGCRAITSDTSDSIITNMPASFAVSNSITWLADTSSFAFAHNQDYTNGDIVAVEISKMDKKKNIEGYMIAQIIACHRDSSYTVRYKRNLWGRQFEEYAIISSKILDDGYINDSKEDSNDTNTYEGNVPREKLHDLYLKKGDVDKSIPEDYIIRYINETEIMEINKDNSDATNTHNNNNNNNAKIETFSSKYKHILELYEDNIVKQKKNIEKKYSVEDMAYNFSFI